MMVVSVEILVKGEPHTYQADGDDMPLTLLEALQEGKAGLMREGIALFLGLSADVAAQLTVRHVKQLGAALKAAGEIPKE